MASYTKLSEFRSYIKSIGLPTSSHFHVEIPSLGTSVNMLCESTDLPGIAMLINETRIIGEVIPSPQMVQYQQQQLTFVENNYFSVRESLERWFNTMYNTQTRVMSYKKEYAKDVNIYVTDRAGDTRYCVTLHEAFPVAIGASSLSWNVHDLIRIPVTLHYRYWTRRQVDYNGEIVNDNLDAFVGSELNPFTGKKIIDTLQPESLGNITGIVNSIKPSDMPNVNLSDNSAVNLVDYGTGIRGEFQRNCSAAGALLQLSHMTAPGDPNFGPNLGNNVVTLGNSMGTFGTTMTELGKNLGAIGGVVGTVSSAIVSVAGTIGSVNSLLSAVGINTGLGKIASDMSQIAGQVGVVSQLKGLPGLLGGFGANMGATGGEINRAIESIKTLPGATNQITNTLGTLSNSFTNRGSELGQVAQTISNE